MQYWNDLYTELAEKITGLKNKGKVDTLQDLELKKNPQQGDAYLVKDETNKDGACYIYRFTIKKDEYNRIVSRQWINTYKTSFEGSLPDIKWVDLWHEQISFLTEELPFSTPALFIGFSTIALDDRGILVQDCDTQIDMYLFFETFSDTYWGSYNQDRALDFLESLTKLHALFHGKSGKNYSGMRRVDMRREDSGGAGNLYRISFQCLVTDYSAQHLFIESQNPDKELDIKKGTPTVAIDERPLYDIGE